MITALLLWAPTTPAAAACPGASDSYSSAVLADSPVAYYRLDETSGPTLCDSSAGAQNGTFASSGVSFGVAGALSSNAAVDVSSPSSGIGSAGQGVTGNQSFTFEGWFRSTGTAQNQALVDMGQGGSGHIAGLTTWIQFCGTGSGGPSTLGLDEYASSNCWDTSSANVNLWDGQWHYVAVSYDQATNQVTGYADGQSLGPEAASASFNLAASPIRLGNWIDTFVNQPFVGNADEIAVYGSALPAGRVAAHYLASGRSLPGGGGGGGGQPPPTVGQVHGAVTDTGHGGSGVAGAQVQLCPAGQLHTALCHVLSTDSSGSYRIGGLAPGSYAMEVKPPSANLIYGSATVQVSAGADVQEDFPLHAPSKLPKGVKLTGVAGTYDSGVPTIFWDSPYTVTYPIDFPGGLKDGAKVTVIVQDTIRGTGSGGGGIGLEAVSTGHFTLRGGDWVLTAEHTGPPAVAGSTACGGPPPAPPPPNPLANPGAFLSNAFAQAASALTHVDEVNADLNAQTHGSTENSHTESVTVDPVDCIPDPNDPGRQVALCPPGSHRSNGDQDCSPDDGSPWNNFPPGDPGGAGDFDGYVDPSGNVFTTHGAPVPNATVWLERSDTLSPPKFTRPTPSSRIMLPAVNPERTDAGGFFHWDVLAGYYRVQASRKGCVAAHKSAKGKGKRPAFAVTPTFPVPPPKLGLKLVLSCPHLTRSATRTALRAAAQRKVAERPLLLIVKVSGRHGRLRPTGVVTIKAGRRTLASLALDSHTSSARITLTGAAARSRRLVASYAGDGYFRASRSKRR